MRALLLLLVGFAVHSAEPELAPFSARYSVEWAGMSLGEASVTLKQDETPGCYLYESATNPVGLVRFFYGAPYELSRFCLEKGRLVPRHFLFSNAKRDKDSFTLEFDWKEKIVRSNRVEPRPLPDNAQDRFGLQQAVRLWALRNFDKKDPGTVEFTMIEDDRTKVYRFALGGRETVTTPAGEFNAVRVQRVDNPDKTSTYWLAPPEQGGRLVKVEQLKDGKPQLRMVLLR